MFDRLIDVLVEFLDSLKCAVVVQPYQRAVRIRLGKRMRDLEPGLRLRLPFGIDKVLVANVARETADLAAQALTTLDGKNVVASAVVTYRVKDVRRFLIETEGAQQVLADASRGPIRRVLGRLTWDQLQTQDDVDELVTKAVRKRAFAWGIEVEGVTLSDLSLCSTSRLLLDGKLGLGHVHHAEEA